MFAYCNNNPIIYEDHSGETLDTVFDVGSLIVSAVELAANPTDLWALASFSADLLDVLLPLVSGLGETVRAIKSAESVSDVITYTNKVKKQMDNASDYYHSFPKLVDELIDADSVQLIANQRDGAVRLRIQSEGSMNIGGKNKEGLYEYVFDLNGSCNHRLFKEVK